MNLKISFVPALFVCLLCAAAGYGQQFKWVKGGGSTGNSLSIYYDLESVYRMTTDENGNIYCLSMIGSDAPIVADTFFRAGGAYGPTYNVFISSYNCSGSMRWAKLIASNISYCRPYSIKCDKSGHVYVAAYISNNTSYIGYDTTITGHENQVQALIQFDTAGHFNWIRYVGPNIVSTLVGGISLSSSLDIDSANNAHFFCNMGYGVQITSTVTSHFGTYDLQYDPLGNLVSVAKLALDSTLNVMNAVIDKQTNKVYAYGQRYASFMGAQHPFLAALDANRNLIWEDTLRTIIIPGSAGFGGVVCDGKGKLYISGFGSGSTIYRSDTAKNTLLAGGYAVSFIMRTDTAGAVQWIRGYSGTSGVNNLPAITFLGQNKIGAVGGMTGKVRSGYDSIVSYTGEGQNSFLTVVDTAGSLFTIQQIHGAGFSDQARAATSDRNGSLYIGGEAEINTWGGSLTPYSSIGGSSDFYVMKYGADCDCTASPVADFTAVGTHTVNFTYTGTSGSTSLDSVRWYFGDGGTSTVLNPTHVYTTAGTFNACVRVYSSCGGDVECKNIVITCPYTPIASFTATGVFNKNFTYTGTTAGMDSIRWRFGDGGTSTLTNPSHTYTSPGTYTACVSIYTWCAWDSSCITFTVPCVTAPTAAFTVAGTPPTKNFTYTGTTVATDSVRWYFGDGGTSTLTNPTHTYGAIGTYTVCVTVYNPCGSSTVCHVVTIPCTGIPVAAFSSSGSTEHKDFSYFGSTVGVDSLGWDFGDGWRVTGMSPSHTYTAIGLYHVCVYAYSACGNDTLCYDIEVSCLTPTASFTHSATLDSFGHFVYTGTTAGIDSVKWNFGDGYGTVGSAVDHHYLTTGIYTVCATVFSSCGYDTVCDTISIYHPVLIDESAVLSSVTVVPNPAKDKLVIENAVNCDLVIYNLLGQKMMQTHVNGSRQILSVAHLSSAVYIIQITSPAGPKRSMRLFKE